VTTDRAEAKLAAGGGGGAGAGVALGVVLGVEAGSVQPIMQPPLPKFPPCPPTRSLAAKADVTDSASKPPISNVRFGTFRFRSRTLTRNKPRNTFSRAMNSILVPAFVRAMDWFAI
jgi:hypothetical protein